MKTVLLSFLMTILLSVNASSQIFNRAYVNAELGFHYQGWGGYLHLKDHFVAGYNAGEYAITVSDVYVDYYYLLFFPHRAWVMNRYDFNTFMAGVTTGDWLDRFCGSLMMGPSWISATEHENIVIKEGEYSHAEYAEYDRVVSHRLGCSMRADMLFAKSEVFGFNFGVRYDFQPQLYRSNFTFQLGINIGLVDNYQSWKRF